jgi:hypothetical protein
MLKLGCTETVMPADVARAACSTVRNAQCSVFTGVDGRSKRSRVTAT